MIALSKFKLKSTSIVATTLALAITLCGCGTTKQVQGGVGPLDESQSTGAISQQQGNTPSVASIAATFGNWTTLQTSGTIALSGARSIKSAMQMRMTRDKGIYISFRPLLGIEVAKVVITGDSVLVVDKVHKQYIAEKVSLLTAGIPVNVSTVQDIFLGRPFILGEGSLTTKLASKALLAQNGSTLTVQPKQQYDGFSYAFDFGTDSKIQSLNVTATGKHTGAYSVKYGDVTTTTVGNAAHNLHIATKVKNKDVIVDMKYNEITPSTNDTYDMRAPSGYKRIDAAKLLQSVAAR